MKKEEAKRILEKAAILARDTKAPSNGEPLTLEQLREMDGMPAFGVSLINEKPGEWFIVRVVEMSKTWFIACAGASQGFGDKDTYGESWLAYAYPTALIDREKWEPCEFCGEWMAGDCGPKEQDAGYKLYAGYCKQVAADDFFEDETEELNYCPICGRPLTPEAWEEMEARLMPLPEPPKEG